MTGINNLIKPNQGTKIIIEGRTQKSGKTLLGGSIIEKALDTNPGWRAFGNMPMDITHYECVDELTPDMFEKGVKYIVFFDELDINYPYQLSYDNYGLMAFWGMGSSHNRAAVIVTLQNDYSELQRKLQRNVKIVVERALFNPDTKLPFAVIGTLAYSVYHNKQLQFLQNISNIVGKYDPYEEVTHRIKLWSFGTTNKDREDAKNKVVVTRMHEGQRKMMEKMTTAMYEDYGTIQAVSQKTGISRDKLREFLNGELRTS